jgi:hypothetical protein
VIWLLIIAASFGFLFLCLLLEQLLFERRPQPRIALPVKAAPPPMPQRPSGWGHADYRHTRPLGTGRHRRPGPTA